MSLVRHIGIPCAYLNPPWKIKLERFKSLETLRIFDICESWDPNPRFAPHDKCNFKARLATHIQRYEAAL